MPPLIISSRLYLAPASPRKRTGTPRSARPSWCPIAGVNFLGELPPKLRQAALVIDDKVPSGITLEDAETLAEYAGLVLGTIGFNFTQAAMT